MTMKNLYRTVTQYNLPMIQRQSVIIESIWFEPPFGVKPISDSNFEGCASQTVTA